MDFPRQPPFEPMPGFEAAECKAADDVATDHCNLHCRAGLKKGQLTDWRSGGGERPAGGGSRQSGTTQTGPGRPQVAAGTRAPGGGRTTAERTAAAGDEPGQRRKGRRRRVAGDHAYIISACNPDCNTRFAQIFCADARGRSGAAAKPPHHACGPSRERLRRTGCNPRTERG